MVTAVHAAVQEGALKEAQMPAPIATPETKRELPASLTAALNPPATPSDLAMHTPGVDPFDFVKDDRIHVKDGSLFIDGYLVLHPHELAPENTDKLKKKLELTYSVNNPSFYEDKSRLSVALNLGQLIPVSLTAKHSQLQQQIKKYNTQVDSGTDADLLKLDNDKLNPFAAIVRDTLEKPAKDPVGIETLKNGLSIYLLMREKMTSMGYRNGLATYVTKSNTPDQVLTDLGAKIGVTPLQVREAALRGGIDGVGQLLGLDAAYVKDVKNFTDYAANQEFSLNAIEHWHQGRHLLGVQAPLAEKIAVGMKARIEKTISNARDRVHHLYEVADPIKHEQERIAEALNLVEPIQRALMYKLGYEICFTPDMMADGIAFYPGIYGLHRKAANDLRDTKGTYHIYFSGRGDLKASMRTLVHEIAHNLWPEQFTTENVKEIDALARSDENRFIKLNKLLDEKFTEFDRLVRAFQAGNDEEKAVVIAAAKEQFKDYGLSIDEGLIPYVRDAHDFRYMVKHAYDTLRIEGNRYAVSGYNSAHERFREIISRFAELKQVEYKSEPQLLHYLAPGLDQIWEAHYIPHLERVYKSLDTTTALTITKPALADVAMTANENIAAKIAELPSIEASPKVDQRPNPEPVNATPVKPADACIAESAPQTNIEVGDAQYQGMMNERSVAALNTLAAMGIQPSR